MKYCSQCGAPVTLRVPEGDTLPRYVCGACHAVHYQNPKLVIGSIPEWEDRVLLCRRAIEPRRGLWTLPAGFMENRETTAQAAERETEEEALARVEIGALFSLFNVPHISQVHMFYRARLLDMNFGAGTESLEVKLFREDDIRWDEVAFSTVRQTLLHYFADRRHGSYGFHMGDIHPAPSQSGLYNGPSAPDFLP